MTSTGDDSCELLVNVWKVSVQSSKYQAQEVTFNFMKIYEALFPQRFPFNPKVHWTISHVITKCSPFVGVYNLAKTPGLSALQSRLGVRGVVLWMRSKHFFSREVRENSGKGIACKK